MENDDDYPKIGRDFQKWSELDSRLPILNLDVELFIRKNVRVARLVVLSALLKSDRFHREKLLSILTPRHFDPKSLPRYLFEKIVIYLQEHEAAPDEVELEKWIPQFAIDVWCVSVPQGRSLYGDHFTLRQILNFDPTEEQVYRAIELRKMVMDQKGY